MAMWTNDMLLGCSGENSCHQPISCSSIETSVVALGIVDDNINHRFMVNGGLGHRPQIQDRLQCYNDRYYLSG